MLEEKKNVMEKLHEKSPICEPQGGGSTCEARREEPGHSTARIFDEIKIRF